MTHFMFDAMPGWSKVTRHSFLSCLGRSNTFLDWSTALLQFAAERAAEAEGLRPQARRDYERQVSSARMIDESLAAYEPLLRNRELPRLGVDITASRA